MLTSSFSPVVAPLSGDLDSITTPGNVKAQILAERLRLRGDYTVTSNCRDPAPSGEASGHSASCSLQPDGLRETGTGALARYVSA